MEDLRQIVAGKGRLAGQAFVKQNAQRVLIRRKRGALALFQLLGRQVTGRPYQPTAHTDRHCPDRRAQALGDTEVEHLRVNRAAGAAGQKDVVRLDVPVDDAVIVRVRHRCDDGQRDLDRLLNRQLPPLEPLIEILPVQILHHQEADAILEAKVGHVHDVRMAQAR